jgi:hypothetical protein
MFVMTIAQRCSYISIKNKYRDFLQLNMMKNLPNDAWINRNKHQKYIEGKQTLFIIKILILIPRKIGK